jgi:galactokinase
VAHALVSGEYAARRAECEEAARLLRVRALGSVTGLGGLGEIGDPVLRRRARHVITDCARARAMAAALLADDYADRADGAHAAGGRTTERDADTYRYLGKSLVEGHVSLRDDFEVSWPEADVTVDAALAAGALGARMIGGGFGGSVLALVRSAAAEPVRAAVAKAFARRSWTAPQFLSAAPSDSARRVALG